MFGGTFRPVLGYAMTLAIIQAAWRVIPLAFGGFSALGFQPGDASSYACFGVGYIPALLLVGLRGMASCPLRYGSLALQTGCLVLGCLSISAGLFGVSESPLATGIGVLLLGVGSAVSFAMWQQSISQESQWEAGKQIALGTALASLLAVVLAVGSLTAFTLLMAACVVGNTVLLASYCRSISVEGGVGGLTVTFARPSAVKSVFSTIWPYIVCIGAIGVASRISQATLVERSDTFALNVTYSVSMIAAAAIFLLIWKRWGTSFPFRKVYSVLMFAVAAAVLVLPLFGDAPSLLAVAISHVAYSIVSMFLIITTVELAKSKSVNPTLVFGLFVGGVCLVADMGPLMVGGIGFTQSLPQTAVVPLVAIYCLSFAGVVLSFRGRGSEQDDALSLYEIPEKEEALEPLPGFKAAATVQQDFIPACCEVLQKRYRLTARQTDVLELIARGRDLTRIADALFVSHNTARSHCRSLYKKLDVHKRQEIIDMLEDVKNDLQEQSRPTARR